MTADRPTLQPSPDHPITIERTGGTVVVTVEGREIARTSDAVTLTEATYPPVLYIPLVDVDPQVLRPSDTTTYCPYKGDASYYSVDLGNGTVLEDVIWSYRTPSPAVSDIAGRVAFYPNRTEITHTT